MVIIGSAGVLAPGKWLRSRALGWLVLLCAGIVLLFNAVARATLWLTIWTPGSMVTSSTAPPALKAVAAIAGSVGILTGYRLAVARGERRAVPELALRRAPVDLLLGLGIGAAAMATIV